MSPNGKINNKKRKAEALIKAEPRSKEQSPVNTEPRVKTEPGVRAKPGVRTKPSARSEPFIKAEPLDDDLYRPASRGTSQDSMAASSTRGADTVPEIPIERIWDYANSTKGEINLINISIRTKGVVPDKYRLSVQLFINFCEASALTAASIPKNKKFEFLRVLRTIRDGNTKINNVETPYTEDIKARAGKLVELYDADIVDDFAELELDKSESEDADIAPSARGGSGAGGHVSVKSTKGKGKKVLEDRVIYKPRPTHPIYGDNGPMRGLTYSTDKNNKHKAYVLNDQYALERRNPNVAGSNGIAPNTWYPFQLNALFHGAHGSRMGGISGDKTRGAYSIVVSGMYSDLDVDKGDVLLYSGSGSHMNANPDAPIETNATALLKTSRQTHNLVRVLRSASSGGARQQHRLSPAGGLRYDGLYEVVGQSIRHNKLGGAYYQFRLERRDTWAIDATVPSREQLELLKTIRNAVI